MTNDKQNFYMDAVKSIKTAILKSLSCGTAGQCGTTEALFQHWRLCFSQHPAWEMGERRH